jgi:hypothetical protein
MEELILSKIASDYSFSKVLTKITFKTNTKTRGGISVDGYNREELVSLLSSSIIQFTDEKGLGKRLLITTLISTDGIIFVVKEDKLLAKSAIQVKWYPRTPINSKSAIEIRGHALRDIDRWKDGFKSCKMEVDWSSLNVDFWIVSPTIDTVLEKPIIANDHHRYPVTIHGTKDWVEKMGKIAEGLMRETYPALFE